MTHLRPGGPHASLLDRRFRRAGELAQRLRHPGIATTVAVGRQDEHLFVAHEFLFGVEVGRLPALAMDPASCAFVARQIARALAYLHGFQGRGLVHNGITPINVHLGFDGRVKLLECGLATAASADAESDGETAPRSFRGGARYTAPELRAGRGGDARSDVFSVGVLLWELLSGRSWSDEELIESDSAPTLRLDGDEAAPEKPRTPADGPRVEAGLYAVVARAMSPEPARRYRDATHLAAALAPFAHSRLTGARTLRKLLARIYDLEGSRRRLREGFEGALPLVRASAPRTELELRRRRALGWGLRAAGVAALAGLAVLAEVRLGGVPPTPTLTATRPAAPGGSSAASAPPPAAAPTPVIPAVASREPRLLPAAIAVERAPAALRATTPTTGRASEPRRRPAGDATARAYESLKAAEDRFQWGDLEGSEQLARLAVRNLADSPRAFYFLGVVLLARGEALEARAAFERVMALDPHYVDVETKLRLANDRAALGRPN